MRVAPPMTSGYHELSVATVTIGLSKKCHSMPTVHAMRKMMVAFLTVMLACLHGSMIPKHSG